MKPFIESVYIRNFKSIKNDLLKPIELKPLTVVIGRNSAGKSSLMQSILLATQHLSSDFASDHRISLNRQSISLGSFDEVRNKRCEADAAVTVGVKIGPSHWQADFIRDDGKTIGTENRSRDAVISRVRIAESPSESNDVLIEINFDPPKDSHSPVIVQRRVPLALPRQFVNSGRGILAEVDGYLKFAYGSTSEHSERPFEYALFVPNAQMRLHPVPLERTDLLQLFVERFFHACVSVSRRLRPGVAAESSKGLLSPKRTQQTNIELPLAEFFLFLLHDGLQRFMPAVTLEEIRTKSESASLDDVDRYVRFALHALAIDNIPPTVIMRRFSMSREQRASTDRSELAALFNAMCVQVATAGQSRLKSQLVPLLQDFFGRKDWPALQPVVPTSTTDAGSELDSEMSRPADELLVAELWSARERLTRAAKHVYYLGPIRDLHLASPPLQDPRALGPKGEQAIEVLANEAATQGQFPMPPGSSLTPGASFNDVLALWLQHFNFAKRVEPEDQGRDRPRINVVIDDDGNSVDVRSVGQGLSQVLPVLMQCLLAAPNDSIVLIEQPELHLHPRLESQLADFFLSCVNTGRQIVIETHSEHLVNQLRFQIAHDRENTVHEQVQILFAEQVNGETQFRPAGLDAYGGLADDDLWPQDFLDLDTQASERIVDAAVEKRIAELEREIEESSADDHAGEETDL